MDMRAGSVGRSIGDSSVIGLPLLHADVKPRRGGRGPNLLAGAAFGTWSTFGTATGLSQDANGLYFAAVANSAGYFFDVALEDNAIYECEITGTFTGGSLRVQVYGATTAHLGSSNAISTNGKTTFQVTTNAAGSFANRVRILANGTSGTNTFTITAITLRRVG